MAATLSSDPVMYMSCNTYIKWDFLALLLLGFVWR